MPRFLVVPIAIAFAIAGYVVYVKQLPEASEPVRVDAVVAEVKPVGPIQVEFELADLDGEMRSIREWDGTHRIINFWATWCAPCRREIPLLKDFQDQHGADGFQVIGIAVEFLEPVIAYAAEAEFNYPILVGEQDAMAVAETSGIDFIGLPFTMIVANDGRLVGAHMGEIHQEELDAIIDVLNQLDAGTIDIAAAKTALDLL